MANVQLHVVVSPIFSENAYIAHLDGERACVIVDPGLDVESIFDWISEQGLTPEAILNTHGHADHIAGNGAIKERWPEIPLVIGADDADKLTDPQGNLSAMFGIELVSPPADQTLREGEVLEVAGMRWDILETPGHCRGHIVFVCKDTQPWIVFGGDVLFREGVGRTDFPDGDSAALGRSIREKMFQLPADTIILTGHGAATTIEHEKKHNPFVDLL